MGCAPPRLLLVVQSRNELLRVGLYLIQDLPDQRAADILSSVMGQRRVAPIRVPIEHMTTLLTDNLKAPLQKDPLQRSSIHNGQLSLIHI